MARTRLLTCDVCIYDFLRRGILFSRIVEKHEKIAKIRTPQEFSGTRYKQVCLSPVQIIYRSLLELFIECLSTVAAVTLQGMFIPSFTFN